MSSEKPDQIQASVAAALSRLRGDLGPSGAAAPKVDASHAEMGRPANDVRGDPFFRSIQSAPPSGGGMAGATRSPIPMTPFARMQAPQEPSTPEAPPADDPAPAMAESTLAIEIPEMPERTPAPDLVSMPETAPAAPPAAAAPSPQPAAPPVGPSSPLSRVMRGVAPADGPKGPAQRDLLAGLPPPPINEPLTEEPESGAMRRRRRNRRLLALAAVIVVAAIGAWLWTGSEKSAEVPVIAADATPEKVKPADEGGLQVPNQNVQVLENMSGAPAPSQGETVMPEPEQPVTPPVASEAQTPSAEQAPAIVESTAPESGATSAAPEAPAVDAPPAPEAPLATSPLPEQTENAAADATAVPPSPQPASPAPQPAQTEPAAAPTADGQAAATEPAPAAIQPVPAPAPSEPAQPAKAEPTATQEAAVTPTPPMGKSRIQLAAGKSEDAVKKEWAALQKAHPDLLGPLTLNIERVDKGASGVFYRLQAGPLADKAAAKKLCASLKQAHQDCIVVN